MMYSNPCDSNGLGSHRGLGQLLTATGYQVNGGGSSHPCQDTMFRMMNRESCARMGYNGITAAPEPVPVYAPPPEEAVFVAPQPVGTEPVYLDPEPVIGEPAGEVVVGAGGGWGPNSPAAQLTVGGTEVFVEAEEEAPGFGILEVALAAGLAWVLSQAYRRRGR